MKIALVVVLVASSIVGLIQTFGKHEQNVALVSRPSFVIPQSRVVRPQPMLQRNVFAQPLVASSTGTIVDNITISIKSTLPTSDVISCAGTASVFEGTTGHSILEQAGVAATRTGSTATCSVKIPYSWSLASPSSDMVTLGFVITVPPTGGLPNRITNQQFASIHVPTNGSTTTETISATI